MAEGKEVRVPQRVAMLLAPNEQVLAVFHETRFKEFLNPDSIYVTNQRVIRYSPTNLGLKAEIEDYRYQDMSNVEARTGVVFGEVHVDMRFESESLVFKNITRATADRLHKLLSQGILSVAPATPTGTMMRGAMAGERDGEGDPLQILKVRLAKGEITQEEYEQMVRLLQGQS
jgi:hypothetical protein